MRLAILYRTKNLAFTSCFGDEMSNVKPTIIVLGYSLNEDCSLSPLLISRLDKAFSLYQVGTNMILSGGMPPAVIKKDRCTLKTEAEAMKAYMISKGVSENDLFVENLSASTLTNAYYSRLLHLDPMAIKEITIVSNQFHEKLINYCFSLILGESIQFELKLSPNDGINEDETQFWDKVITQLVSNCYPLLFKNVIAGDMEAIHKIINGKYLTQKERQNRVAFEACFRELISIENKIPLNDFI